MKQNIPLETSVTKSILKYLKTVPFCRAEKRHGGAFGNSGKPDITGCINGLRFEFEVKRGPFGYPATELQKKELAEWNEVNAIVAVVYNVDEVKQIIKKIQEYNFCYKGETSFFTERRL